MNHRSPGFRLLLISLCLSAVAAVQGGEMQSSSYSIEAMGISGGGFSSSPSYHQAGSSSGIAENQTGNNPAPLTLHSGLAGQGYRIAALNLRSDPSFDLPEGTSANMIVELETDAGTIINLPPERTELLVLSGPVTLDDTSDQLDAEFVYTRTLVTVGVGYAGLGDLDSLSVVNTGDDDFGIYAADQVDDAWQVNFFGPDNPDGVGNEDFDGDSQSNRFEFEVGTLPDDPSSTFRVRIDRIANESHISFGPVFADRSYTILRSSSLTPASFSAVSLPTTDDGQTRTAIDSASFSDSIFYQVSVERNP